MRDTMIYNIKEWVEREENIRLAVLEGSLGSEQFIDNLSDIDINLFCYSYEDYLSDDNWISKLSNILVYIPEKFMFAEKTIFTRLVIFENGIKVDFSFWTMDNLEDIINKKESYYNNGHKVLVDKDNVAKQLSGRQNYKRDIPTSIKFDDLVKSFFFNIHYVAKFLKRGELWYAKHINSFIMDKELLIMIEWYAKAKSGCIINTFFKGRHIQEWLGGEDYQRVCELFTDYNLDRNWDALFNMIDLFREMSLFVAQKYKFNYPSDIDFKMTNLLKKIRNN